MSGFSLLSLPLLLYLLCYLLVDLVSPPNGLVVERVQGAVVAPGQLGRVQGQVGPDGLVQGHEEARRAASAAHAKGSQKGLPAHAERDGHVQGEVCVRLGLTYAP